MNVALISALAGLAGAAIGGATSTFGSILSERTKSRRQAAEDLYSRHVGLYIDFIDEAAKHFADAMTRTTDDPKQIVKLYGLIARMRLGSPDSIVAAAEDVMVKLQQAYVGPTLSLSQIEIFKKGGQTDPLFEFSLACRRELARMKAGLLS